MDAKMRRGTRPDVLFSNRRLCRWSHSLVCRVIEGRIQQEETMKENAMRRCAVAICAVPSCSGQGVAVSANVPTIRAPLSVPSVKENSSASTSTSGIRLAGLSRRRTTSGCALPALTR